MTLGSPLMRLGPGSYLPMGCQNRESTGFSESRRGIVLPAEHLNPGNRPTTGLMHCSKGTGAVGLLDPLAGPA
jgi:hypothetical protein